jgi:uncharacterized membrane-anchored protein
VRRAFTTLFVLAQVLVLGFMAGEREYILRFGTTVYLRTAPIDPRDIFRGDFVRLDYDISAIGVSSMKGTLKEHLLDRDKVVYAALSRGANDLASLDYATDEKPDQELYIRGRLTRGGRFSAGTGSGRVRYGIEQLFVEQGTGKAIEKRRSGRDGLQIPLEVAVALGGGGTAVIKGHRWSRLGVKLEVLRAARRNRNDNLDEIEGPLSPKLRVTLKNVSEAPLAVVNPGQDCGFELTPLVGSRQTYQSVDRGCQTVRPTDGDVVLLAPEAAYSVELDLSEARWHVKTGNKVSEIGRLDRFDRFRMTYRAPDQAALEGLTAREAVWPGYLPTRAFDAFGRID